MFAGETLAKTAGTAAPLDNSVTKVLAAFRRASIAARNASTFAGSFRAGCCPATTAAATVAGSRIDAKQSPPAKQANPSAVDWPNWSRRNRPRARAEEQQRQQMPDARGASGHRAELQNVINTRTSKYALAEKCTGFADDPFPLFFGEHEVGFACEQFRAGHSCRGRGHIQGAEHQHVLQWLGEKLERKRLRNPSKPPFDVIALRYARW
jgi:hypothetical protein